MNYTDLEKQFMETLKAEAYGGLTFTGDINPVGMKKAQKSGVVSSLVKKNILVIDERDELIGLVPENGDTYEAVWEFRGVKVAELMERA